MADRKALAEKQAELAAMDRQKGTLPSEVEAAKVKADAATAQLEAVKAGA
jgi:hypothetical protein